LRRTLLILLLAAATRIAAQEAENFILTTEPGSPVANRPVVLHIEEYTRAESYSPAFLERQGNVFVVHQTESINIIAIIEGHGWLHWSLRSMDLGILPAGEYFVVLEQHIDDYLDSWNVVRMWRFDVGRPTKERPRLGPADH
jgi:hypothetical protein